MIFENKELILIINTFMLIINNISIIGTYCICICILVIEKYSRVIYKHFSEYNEFIYVILLCIFLHILKIFLCWGIFVISMFILHIFEVFDEYW